MAPDEKPQFLQFDKFFRKVTSHPEITMIWGDVGVGKTTISLQIADTILSEGKKVFFLSTKQSSIDNLIRRCISPTNRTQNPNIFFWNVETLHQQIQAISGWILQIEKLKTAKVGSEVGLIIIDEIVNLYLIEIGSEAKNSKLNDQLTHILAILSKLNKDFDIPILVLNSFSNKTDQDDKITATPHGGKIINYWIDSDIQVKRTPQPSRRTFSLKSDRTDRIQGDIPSQWTWKLTGTGFK